jgi:hypothetical protein
MKYLSDEPIISEILVSPKWQSISNGKYSDFYIKLFRLNNMKNKDTLVFKKRGYLKPGDEKYAPFKVKTDVVSDIIPRNEVSKIYFNHYSYSNCITDKLNLIDTLTLYYNKLNNIEKLFDITPITFNLNSKEEQEAFALYKSLNPKSIWIYKPQYEYGGKGITFTEPKVLDGVAQEYIQNPLLYKGRKFDIRVFAMMSGNKPDMYIYPSLLCRTSSYPFTLNDFDNLYIHITNHVIQKESPNYEKYEKGNILILDLDILSQIKDIIKDVFNASLGHIGPMYKTRFEIFGFDFIVDDTMKVKLIEVNENPSLKFDNPEVDAIIKKVILEAIDISVYYKSKKEFIMLSK